MVQLDLILLLEGPKGYKNEDRLQALVDLLIETVNSTEYKIVHRGVRTGRPRKDALLALVPRKKHLRTADGWRCSTVRVSPKNLVDSMEEVDCKLCLPARVGDRYYFAYPDEPQYDKCLTVIEVSSYEDEGYVYFDDGTHAQQKNLVKVPRHPQR